jgi:hypothetical protein
MLKLRHLPLLILLPVITTSCASQNLIEFIKDGKSGYTIYYNKASDASANGASVLHDYLYKISGADLGTTTSLAENKQIIIGKDTSLPNHAIHIYAQRKNIFISGGNEESVSNAVYEFLEKFTGCRFYADDAVLVPKKQTLSVPENIEYSYQPPFRYRYVHYNYAYKPGYAAWNKLTTVPGDVNNVRFPVGAYGCILCSRLFLLRNILQHIRVLRIAEWKKDENAIMPHKSRRAQDCGCIAGGYHKSKSEGKVLLHKPDG